MSRGPGKWQRAILAGLASQETFWLRSLLGPSCTKAEYNALLRAAMKLEEAGLILMDRYEWGSETGVGKTAVRRIGTSRPERRSVSVCKRLRSSTVEPYQHLSLRRQATSQRRPQAGNDRATEGRWREIQHD
jgi:hypothetical protein